MKAVALERYGPPQDLELTDLPDPKVGPDSVLVRVRSAGCNPVDYKILGGGLDAFFPTYFPLVPGWDVAGVVESAGPAITSFRPGDEVIGYVRQDYVQQGTMGEAIGAPFRCLAPKPASLSWNEAGGLPLAGLTAYQALTEALGLQAGQTLFVSAAAGGVGSFAVQLARVLGAEVVGTTSASHADWVRSLGADPVDYTGGDVVAQVRARHPQGVDAVLDLVGGDSLAQAPELLADGGRLASVVDPVTVGRLGGRYVFVRPDSAHLEALGDLVAEGKLRVWVEEAYPLDEAGAALQRLANGHVQGKLVVQVST